MSIDPVIQGKNLVSVIVVSCLKEELLSACLNSIMLQDYPHIECFVFLNCAKEADILRWRNAFPAVNFSFFSDNQLYCRPQNDGIRMSRGEYVLCLNDDVTLGRGYISESVAVMEKDPKIGISSGCLFRPDGTTIDSAGLLWSKSRKPKDRGYGLKPKNPYRPGFVFGVNGAAAFYRRKMLDELKESGQYFDESYGIYYEDFDLSWRAQKAGWKAFYQPRAQAIHKRGVTTRTEKKRLPFSFLSHFALVNLPHDLKLRNVRNRYATILKNDSFFAFILDLPWIIFYELRLLFYLIFFDRGVLRDVISDPAFFSSALSRRRMRT